MTTSSSSASLSTQDHVAILVEKHRSERTCKKGWMSIFLLLLLPSSLLQGSTLNACFSHWPPYSYLDDNGQAKGLSIQVYKTIAAKAGFELSFTELPWQRCKGSLSTGRYDAVVDGGPSIPDSLYSSLRPIVWVQMVWVHNEYPSEEYKDYAQFTNTRIGHNRGFGYPDDFYSFNGFAKRITVNNDLLGLKMLHARRLDAFMGDLYNNRYLSDRHGLNVKPLFPPNMVKRMTMAFSTSHRKEHIKFERAIKETFKEGTLDLIYHEFLGRSYTRLINATHPLRE